MSTVASREERAAKWARGMAAAAASALVAKSAGSSGAQPEAVFAPFGEAMADLEDEVAESARLVKQNTRRIAALQQGNPPATLPAGMHPFDPARWEARLVPTIAQPQRNGHSPTYRDGPADG